MRSWEFKGLRDWIDDRQVTLMKNFIGSKQRDQP